MVDVKKLLSKVTDRLAPTNMFMITSATSSRMNTAANTNGEVYVSATNEGYYPLGVVGYYCQWTSGQTSLINIYLLTMDQQEAGSCRVHCAFRNMYTAVTSWNLQVFILWAKI